MKEMERDYLTGLPNRRSLYQYYEQLTSSGTVHAMFLDVDNYKKVNDIYGHNMGDQLLTCIANYLQMQCDGFISRLGGDEFVILLDGKTDAANVPDIAERLIKGFHKMEFRRDVLSVISLSIGIIQDQKVSQPLDDILEKCDMAMYRAKLNGKNCYTIFRAQDAEFERNRRVELEMETALLNGEFQVYFQPKINMISTGLCGAEALSRWVHPLEGVRSPAEYIEVFEKNGFISKLDFYMFEEVCRIKDSWKGTSYEHIPVSVNMSRIHLYDKKFPRRLEMLAEKYDIPVNELEIELTESTFIKDSEELITMVTALKKKGFLVSIDDFGSGFSALYLLKDLPVDTIKIDRGFLKASSNDVKGKKVIRNIIALCKDLKMDVVTEGIETKEQVDFISSCGCQIAQGYYYAKPLCQEEFCMFAAEFMEHTRDFYNFRLDGDYKSLDGTMEAEPKGAGLSFGQGIFTTSRSVFFPGGPAEQNTLLLPKSSIVNDSFTISMWICPKQNRVWSAAFYAKFESGFCAIIPYVSDNISVVRVRDSREVDGWYDVPGCRLRENIWHHYTVSYNAKTEVLLTFLNGEPVGKLENVPANHYAKRIMIGGDAFQPSFIGNVAEIVIYNEAKDAHFIKELHQRYVERDNFIGFEKN